MSHRIRIVGIADAEAPGAALPADFEVPGDDHLLRGMERLGRRGIPVGCRGGGCGVCKVQVLTVTHAPQVAARAQSHLLIEKQAIEEGAFVRTHVRRLDGKARQEEVARMLAGAKVTDEARAAAGGKTY